jgi:5-methyltetrahydropteroyltriglutamate--homocysteine methyltransferase
MSGFLTHEVGSLQKPQAVLKASKNEKLSQEELKGFNDFCCLINLEPEEPSNLLQQAGPEKIGDNDFHQKLKDLRVQLNIKYKESTGIDIIDAGEWLRPEMYQYFIENSAVSGIKLLDYVRSFDRNFYRPGYYEGKLNYNDNESIHLYEFETALKYSTKPLKVCITAFNTIAEWTLRGKHNFEELLFDIIDTVFIPETRKLLKAGANWLQLDEPALTTHPHHVETFVDAWNYWYSKIKGDLKSDSVLGLHNCFSNYDLLWPLLPELDGLGAITLEFANRDSWELGIQNRPAYQKVEKEIRELYSDYNLKAKLALGVIPVHTDNPTTPELIRDRLLYVNELVGDPNLVLGAPDCGLRQRSLPVAHKLLQNLTEGAKLARETLR